jgi:hypothetical protein
MRVTNRRRNNMHPKLPNDVIDSTPVVKRSGIHPSCIVLHRTKSEFTPYATHVAFVQGDEWHYVHGHYFQASELEKAKEDMKNREKKL